MGYVTPYQCDEMIPICKVISDLISEQTNFPKKIATEQESISL